MTTTINAGVEKTLYIGKQGENLATRVDFGAFAADCLATFGAGTLTLVHERAEDPAPYPIMPVDGRYWDVTSADLQYAGTGYIEATYVVGEVVKKSLRWKTVTLSALGEVVEPPEAWAGYVDAVLKAVASVDDVIRGESARNAAESERAANETARKTAESGRASAENARAAAENGRNAAEARRVLDEQGRASAEQNRDIAETRRETETADMLSDARRTLNAVKNDTASAIGRIDAVSAKVQRAETARQEAEARRETATGKALSDANAAFDKAETALEKAESYADDMDKVKAETAELRNDTAELGTTIAGKLDKPVNEPWTGAVPMYDGGALKWHTSVYSVNGQTGNVELPTVDPSIERRLTNLEYAANGVLYREDVSESEDYEKPLAPDVMPYGTLDKIAGKTIVMNQLVGETYPEPFEGEVYVQTIEAKAKSVDVDSISGKTVVWNQECLAPDFDTKSPSSLAGPGYATIVTTDGVSELTIVTSNSENGYNLQNMVGVKGLTGGHVYAVRLDIAYDTAITSTNIAWLYSAVATAVGSIAITPSSNYQTIFIKSTVIPEGTRQLLLYANRSNLLSVGDKVRIKNVQLFDLTAMGMEDISQEDFNALFPAEYYPYSDTTLRNLDLQRITSAGRNLLNPVFPNVGPYLVTDNIAKRKDFVSLSIEDKDTSVDISGCYLALTNTKMYPFNLASYLVSSGGIRATTTWYENTGTGLYVAIYPANASTWDKLSRRFNIWANYGRTPLPYAPYMSATRDPSAVIAKYFPTGMKSVGNFRDVLDLKGKTARRRVYSYTFSGSEKWVLAAANRFYLHYDETLSKYIAKYTYANDVINASCAGFISKPWSEMSLTVTDEWVGIRQETTRPYVRICSLICSTIEEVSTYMRGRTIYISMPVEDTEPIAEADLAILKAIPVEQGGTLTFEHVEGFAHPIPVTETLNLGEWQQPLDTTHRYSKNGTLLTGAATTSVVGGQDYIIDLTRAGVDTPAAFPEPYYAPNPGELVSKAHEAVVSRGKNLCNLEKGSINVNTGADAAWNAENYGLRSQYIPVSIDKTYDVLMSKNDTQRLVFYYDNDKKYIERSGGTTYSFSFGSSITGNGLSFPKGTKYVRLSFYKTSNTSTLPSEDPDFHVMVRERGKAMDYAPYFESTTPLSTIISKYFPNGMKSAGSVYDELDIENGVAIRRVGSADMASLTWGYYEPASRFGASIIPDFVKKNVNESIKVIASDIYTVTEKIWYISPFDMGICATNGQTIIRDNSANGDAAILKEKLQGVMLYYELADYITTPIAPADLEALRTLHVEAGGSLTFTDTNAGFRIPCGNKETFLVKTGGVSA